MDGFSAFTTAKPRTSEPQADDEKSVSSTEAEWRLGLLRDQVSRQGSFTKPRTYSKNGFTGTHIDSGVTESSDRGTTRAPRTNALVYVQPEERPEERISLGTEERWSTRYQHLEMWKSDVVDSTRRDSTMLFSDCRIGTERDIT